MDMILDFPTYELTLPSNGKKIIVRPFLVKEEKLLLMAVESNDNVEIITATKNVIRNCIIEGDVDVEKLPFFDIDYMFIFLRAKSVAESIDMKFRCNVRNEESGICDSVFPAKIDISNFSIIKDETLVDIIEVSPICKVKMKYPTYTAFKVIHDTDTILNKKIRLIANSIEWVSIRNNTKTMKDMTPSQVIDFIENLTQEQYRKLETYVDNFPYFIVKAKAKCPKCGHDHEIEYRDFESFFA